MTIPESAAARLVESAPPRAARRSALERFGRWYIPARDPRYLRRNALVVLGNTVSPDDRVACSTIERYRRDPDPMLRSHAEWAAQRVAARA